ncbi:MAG TPA: DUF2167 domain-containing protein [Burkholderiaceae bacterium]
MKRLYGVVPLSLLLLAIAQPVPSEGKEPSTSAAGSITEAPANAPATSAPASSVSVGASASASADAVAPAAAAAPTSQATAAASAGAASTADSANAAASPNFNWKIGPREIVLLDQATVKIPQNFAYLEQDDARQLLRKLGNPNADDVMGLFTGPGGNWLLVTRFNKSGYIADSEEPDWQLDELLAKLRKNVEQTNEIRKKNGTGETEIVTWIDKPTYDSKRHRLVWAVSARDKGAKEVDYQSVNYNMYVLGREGYFDFNLVTDLAQLEQNKKYASMLASSIVFKEGKRYRDFKKGSDKLSPYTLTGLVVADDAAPPAEKKEHEPVQTDSKLVKFIKVFGLILLVMLGLAGAVFGAYYFMRKRRAAKLETEVAAAETPQAT